MTHLVIYIRRTRYPTVKEDIFTRCNDLSAFHTSYRRAQFQHTTLCNILQDGIFKAIMKSDISRGKLGLLSERGSQSSAPAEGMMGCVVPKILTRDLGKFTEFSYFPSISG